MTQKEGPSVEANMNYELTPEQEARLDYIVDTTGCSYDDARRSMGLPVEDPRIIKQLMKNLRSTRGIGDKAVKGFFCGDCCRNINPGEMCSHVRIGNRGKRYANDDSRY